MAGAIRKIFQSQQAGLLLVIFALGAILTLNAGSYMKDGRMVNSFFNPDTLMDTAKNASIFAIMAVGATLVIISRGIDLSVGSMYALSGVALALVLQKSGPMPFTQTFATGLIVALGMGLLCGLINGTLIVVLKVHPFIITLGSMWVFRGVAYVMSKGQSILVPDSLMNCIKSPLGLGKTLHPIPMLVMFLIMILGAIYLTKTVAGRHIFAVGGNEEASRFAGLRLNRIMIAIYALCGLCVGVAAFVGASYYGAGASIDGDGYELYVIASAVIGGASLNGGKGSAVSAVLGAILLALIKQSIIILGFDTSYERIIIGCAIVVAVVVDQASARLSARRMVKMSIDAAADKK